MGRVIALSLTACTTDSVFEDMDQQTQETANNGSQNQTNSYNPNDPGIAHGSTGASGPIKRGSNYASPWDAWFIDAPLKPSYIITNGTAEFASPYNIVVTAYAGLAYFDGVDDGLYVDIKTGVQVADFTSGNYPNLYANGHEVGNLVRNTNPYTANAYPSPSSSVRIEATDQHLKNTFGTRAHPTLPNSIYGFDFTNLTSDERDLLKDYGKVFFYEVQIK